MDRRPSHGEITPSPEAQSSNRAEEPPPPSIAPRPRIETRTDASANTQEGLRTAALLLLVVLVGVVIAWILIATIV